MFTFIRTFRAIAQRPTIQTLRQPQTITTKFQPTFRTPSSLPKAATTTTATAAGKIAFQRQFSTSPIRTATYNQVRRGCRVAQRARRARSPQLRYMPQLKGVCLKTGVTKPKKPNSGERKTARIRLSNGRVITAYIPGEGLCFSSILYYFLFFFFFFSVLLIV